MKEKEVVKYKDLSIGLKIPIVMAWVVGTIYSLLLLIGIIQALWYA